MSSEKTELSPVPASERLSSEKTRENGQTDIRMLQPKAGSKRPGILRVSGTPANFLSTWPAHMSSRIIHHGQQNFLKEKPRIHGSDDGPSGAMGKPLFLQQLEDHLRRELQDFNPELPRAQERKLQAYRDVFDYFIEDFRTYKPLLCAIKNEYEITLAYLRDQIRELEPLRAQLARVAEEGEQRIMALREEEKAEITELKRECQRLLTVISTMREEQNGLQAQVSRLQDDLRAQYLAYRQEHDARNLLIDRINSMGTVKEQEKHDEQEEEDILKLKLALQVCREDMTKAQVELNRVLAEFGDVVPRRDWDALEERHQENLVKLETLQVDFNKMKAEYDTLLDEHKQLSLERSSLQEELEGHRSRGTPRPDWEKCADLFGGSEKWVELSEGQSSQKLLEILLEQLGGTTDQQEQGIADDVPACLRYEGNLKNLGLKKADAVRVIKEVWKEKVAEDEQREESSVLAEFLRRHLDRQHGERAGDWAYSLLRACQQHHDDDVIGLFFDILTGKVDESLYHGQTQLLSHLLKELIRSDLTESGVLSPQEFSEALKKAFPLKGEQEIEELLTAAQTELDSSRNISYQSLYTEDADGKHRGFLTLLKRQAAEERRLYISQLQDQLGDKGKVDAGDLRAAFGSIDPALNEATLGRYLGLAFPLPSSQQGEAATHLDTNVVLQRLLVADVKRAGPPPQN
ncbi:hypothetical protein MATL_G00145310 [Megalops atlanticus]|uniref:Translin-associated factor X-interacting protein 1 N-terminal domain-containing protein n=1 Tax=Megalops atlanticus TaxID=7932 RepID=A0A9D3PZD1_MEGAT|nr:hypothetical protein MATL_G00145310 [Megalops atlanticus]